MIILIHVLVALASIAVATVTVFHPTIKKLITSYGFIIATIASGTYLIVNASSHILQSCLMGLAYLMGVSLVTIVSHVRLHQAAMQRVVVDMEPEA